MTAIPERLREQLAHCEGKDCTCCAYGERECVCGVDWTSAEVYELRSALLASQQANAGLVAVDVRTQANGNVDEIVGYGHFHLERMDSGHWWLGLGDADRGGAMVNLTSSRAILVSVSGDAAIATQDLQAQGAVQGLVAAGTGEGHD